MFNCRDPCGFALAVLTLCLIVTGNYIANYLVVYYWHHEPKPYNQYLHGVPLTGWGLVFGFVFNYTCFMSIVCHLRAAFADPGIIKKNMDPPEELDLVEVKYCRKCDLSWKPERAHHCSECGHCIYKMDHHCPWVNNCVGVRNQKYFIQFVGYVGISSALLSLYMVLSFYYLLTEKSKDHMKKSGYPTAFIVSIISFIVGILFSFFTFELMQEQIESIEENQTYIDDLKELKGKPGEFMDNLENVMGTDWQWWLIPTHPQLRINYFEKLYTKKEIKKMRQFDEDDSDHNRKNYSLEVKKSKREKKIFGFLCLIFLICWFTFLKQYMLDTYSDKQ